MTARIARLDDRALVRVSGPDARPFLHNLLTQDVETLADGDLRFGALLSPPGRLLFDLFLRGEADGVLLDVAADRRDALLQRLSMYRLRAQVVVEADDRPVFAGWPDLADGFTADPRAPGLGGRRYGGEVETTATSASVSSIAPTTKPRTESCSASSAARSSLPRKRMGGVAPSSGAVSCRASTSSFCRPERST